MHPFVPLHCDRFLADLEHFICVLLPYLMQDVLRNEHIQKLEISDGGAEFWGEGEFLGT